MFNEYYPENTSPDCFENYGGHHIDDRMRARGNSYASHYQIDDKVHYATPEIMEEKKNELEAFLVEYKLLHESVYGENGQERIAGNELADALMPLEALSMKIANLKHFIATARLVDKGKQVSDRVQLLSTVTVSIQGIPAPMTLRIVGQNEMGSNRREVSCVSPVGKALMGRRVGETVDVQVNNRVRRYRILSL
jgi:transcription elongation factor GreA